MRETLQARFFEKLEERPEARALAHADLRGEVVWRTREQVHDWARGCSVRLAELGLEPGQICLLVLPSDEHCAGVVMGVLLRGAIPLLLAPPTIQAQGRYSSLLDVLKQVAKKARPRLVIAPEAMAGLHDELRAGLGKTSFHFAPLCSGAGDSAPGLEPAARPLRVAGTDVAAMQLTSGTTGFPRVCVWRHQDVLAALDSMSAGLALGPEDVCVNWTPLYHDMGLVVNFLLCLTKGVPIVMMNPVDFVRRPALWLRAVAAAEATFTWSPNFGFAITTERARDDELTGVRLDGVRAFWNSSERVHPETVEAFYRRFAGYGVSRESLKTVYGGAEIIGAATLTDPQGAALVETLDERLLQERGIAQVASPAVAGRGTVAVASVGRPCPGIEVRILSSRGRSLPEGHVGEIALRMRSPRTVYLKDARATRRLLRGGLLHTGDLGYRRGNELFWVGRVRERITTMGRKIDPSDLERVLFTVAELRPGCFAAFGVDDPRRGTQRVVVATEVRDSFERSRREVVEDIRRQAFRALGLKIDDVVLVPKGTLTKTSSGKRRHRHFRDLYLRGDLEPLRLQENE